MKYRKLPVEIEAIQYDGSNSTEIIEFCLGDVDKHKGTLGCDEQGVFIETLEGTMRASIGDYVIKGVQGEYYPCKPDIFEQTYEKVGEK